MKAKDTVMSEKEVAIIIGRDGGRGWNVRGSDMVMVETQAEISFKAGIKEVLEAIHYEPYSSIFYVRPEEWEAKLKEWGFTPTKGETG